MRFSKADVERVLQPLIGLRVAQIYHAAEMRGFWFARPDAGPDEATGWCLHVSCPWRLESIRGIVTGSSDWVEHAEREDLLWDEWDPADGGSLQERILRKLLNDDPGEDRTIRNRSNLLIVERVEVDDFGGFQLVFVPEYRLVTFPSTTRGEMWRIFADERDEEHFVAEAL